MKILTTECGCEFEQGSWLTAICEHGREFTQEGVQGGHWLLGEVTERPTVVCLCGSTRFWRTFQEASLNETLAGKIVLSIGAASGTDAEHFGNLPKEEYNRVKNELDILHFRKIDMADEVLILNVEGYIGENTARELIYARRMGKKVRCLEREKEILEDIERWKVTRENQT